MSPRSWPVLAAAFGSLIMLVAFAGFVAARRASQVYNELLRLQKEYRDQETALASIQSDIYLSSVLVRDYLLDPSHISADLYRNQLLRLRSSSAAQLDGLDQRTGFEDDGHRRELRTELKAYWESLDPIFSWTPAQKIAMSALFLRQRVMPRREAVMSIAQDIRALNDASVKRREVDLEQRQRDFRRESGVTLSIALLLAVLVASVSVLYIRRLERQTADSHRRTLQAEREMRRLSHQVVKAQEDERKSLSRELHDEVGQTLTALRIELGNLERAAKDGPGPITAFLQGAKELAERGLQSVRRLAMGLRPSMLDDLGLAPALDWQAREFSRRSGVPVELGLDGQLDNLPDAHRTCIYRIVQEALTNCARHANAKDIRIMLHGNPTSLSLSIQDDGVGFSPAAVRGRGLGLIGIEERVHELGGRIAIRSQPSKGTVLSVHLPVPAPVTAGDHA
ncbi:MAG: sensor histidine kinase [Bryobacteraceae bacterium]